MKKFRLFGLIMLSIIAFSCGDGDDGILEGMAVEARPLSEVAAENDIAIRTFLETHFYNYEEFANPPADFDFEIRLGTIEGENADKIPMIDQVETRTVTVSAFEFLIDGEEDIPHTYYYLEARKGKGIKPTIADSTFVNYKALLLDGTVFDRVPTGTWWDNPTFQFVGTGNMRSFRGVAEGVVNIAAGTGIIENTDGTFEAQESGVGMIIFPSALSTFNGRRGAIPEFSPLIFQIEVLVARENTDHDNDGIPSIMEDVNEDNVIVNDDTDLNLISNFQDPDDDGDGILTFDEIEIDAEGNLVRFLDSDNDGIWDHLDNDEDN